MTNRELLEWAATALGLKTLNGKVYGLQGHHHARTPADDLLCDNDLYWNPLIDDGDALRLAGMLGISLELDAAIEVNVYEYSPGQLQGEYKHGVEAWFVRMDATIIRAHQAYGDDKMAAIRHTIVRAAAEIGKPANIAIEK